MSNVTGFGAPGYPPQWGMPGADPRFGVQCQHCARTQPVAPGLLRHCVYCGAVMPIQRWRAHPPPMDPLAPTGSQPAASPVRSWRARRRHPYAGPPSYGPAHPLWGFPPVVWRRTKPLLVDGEPVTADDEVAGPGSLEALGASIAQVTRGSRFVVTVAVGAAAAALVAAGADAWRFALLMAGRTAVLDGDVVSASDALVGIAGACALILGLVTAFAAVPVLAAMYRAAAYRAGRVPGRPGASVVSRLVVPGWNLYGAGQILAEIVRVLRLSDTERRSSRWALPVWWVAWAANGVAVVVTLVMAFGRSNQWLADTVQAHIVVDVLAAASAGLFAVLLGSLSRGLRGAEPRRYDGWAVRPPTGLAGRSEPDRGEPDQGEPGRGEPDQGEPGRGEADRSEPAQSDVSSPESTGVDSNASTTSAI